MSRREYGGSPGTTRRTKKAIQHVDQGSPTSTETAAAGAPNGKEKNRLPRTTSDFGNERLSPHHEKPKLTRSLSSGPRDPLPNESRSGIRSVMLGNSSAKSPMKDDSQSLLPPAPVPTSSSSGQLPASTSKDELRKSSAMKRLSQVHLISD